MKKFTKLETIGFILAAIGAIFWISENYMMIEFLKPMYPYTRIIFWIAVAIWALGFMQKERRAKDKN